MSSCEESIPVGFVQVLIEESRYKNFLNLESKLLAGELVEPVRCKECAFRGLEGCPRVNAKDYFIYDSLDNNKYCAWGYRKPVVPVIVLDAKTRRIQEEYNLLISDRDKFAEKNERLIYWFMKKHELFIDDWYDVCSIGFVKAMNHYDPKYGINFSSYCYTLMLNEVRMEYRRINHRVPIALSLDDDVKDGNGGQSEMSDIIGAEDQSFDDVIFVSDLANKIAGYKSKYRERNLEIIKLYYSGYTHRAIGKKLDLSQSYISRIIDSMHSKIMP
jgi:RNA polymerase sigma factor (sigma-70 family)